MDMLLNRYSNIEWLMEQDIEFGMGMIVEGFEGRRRDEAYMLYSSVYPNMTQETFVSFEQFYMPRLSTSGDVASVSTDVDEIMGNVKDMMSGFGK